jgi:hypothetical protein
VRELTRKAEILDVISASPIAAHGVNSQNVGTNHPPQRSPKHSRDRGPLSRLRGRQARHLEALEKSSMKESFLLAKYRRKIAIAILCTSNCSMKEPK